MKRIRAAFFKPFWIILRSIKKQVKKYQESEGIYYPGYNEKLQELLNNGLEIGKNVTIEDPNGIDCGYPYLIRIGDNCSLAEGVRVLAHDDTLYKFTGGYARLGKIEIKDNCFIGENVIILPGVTIGPNVLIAAGSVVNKDIPPNSCVAGVPARFYAKFEDFVENGKKQISESRVFDYYELRGKKITPEQRKEVQDSVAAGICFVKGKKGSVHRYSTWNIEDGKE